MKPEDIKVGMRVRIARQPSTIGMVGIEGVVKEAPREIRDGDGELVAWTFSIIGTPDGRQLMLYENEVEPASKPSPRRLTLDEVKAIQRDLGRVRVLRPEGNPETSGSLWREALIGTMHGLSYEVATCARAHQGFVTVLDQLGKLTDVPADCLVDAIGDGPKGLEPGEFVTVRKPAEFYPDEEEWVDSMDKFDGKQMSVLSIREDAMCLKSPGRRQLVRLKDDESGWNFELRWLERAKKAESVHATTADGVRWKIAEVSNKFVIESLDAKQAPVVSTAPRCVCTHSLALAGCKCGAMEAERRMKEKRK